MCCRDSDHIVFLNCVLSQDSRRTIIHSNDYAGPKPTGNLLEIYHPEHLGFDYIPHILITKIVNFVFQIQSRGYREE